MSHEVDGAEPPLTNTAVAIVGAGLRFPGGAHDLTTYWSVLRDGIDAIGPVPADRWDARAWPEAPAHGGFLDDIATFDASFFRISPREAVELDPAQRLLLEVAWEALEDAAMAPDRLERSQTGVYIGLGLSDYGRRHFLAPGGAHLTPYSGTGSFLSVAAGRIAYTLGLEGPAMTIDTACSSSLVTVHLAVEALRRGEVDAALAGGANVILAPEPSVYFARLDALAADGRCKTFSAAADGYGRGEGAGIVVLKRLDDALADGDRILAVIHGSAVNQDGRSNGLTAPSGRAQRAVLRAALRDAGVEPSELELIEAHGTGTPLGDPIEIEALKAVLAGDGAPVWVGSAKTNFGHLETAAGIAGLLKVALAIQHRTVPPHLHAEPPSPRIDLAGTRLRIPGQLQRWEADTPLGGVSSFGLSGTNAHVVLGPAPPVRHAPAAARPVELITLSAHSEEGLARTARAWSEELGGARLADVAYTATTGRAQLRHRLAVTARTAEELRERLAAFAAGQEATGTRAGPAAHGQHGVVFLFTGQGAQHVGMGQALYREDLRFHEALDEVLAAIDPHLPRPLADVMWGDAEALHDTRFTQPALFALQTALARWWAHLDVLPDAVLGHSIGELSAAEVAGVLSLEDAATLVAARGRLMSELPRDGAMVALLTDAASVDAVLRDHPEVDLAAVNGPTEIVLSGPTQPVEAVARHFEGQGVRVRRLDVSHAFHSALMEPVLEPFAQVARAITYREAAIPLVTNLTGAIDDPSVATPEHWVQHVRAPVRFLDGFRALIDDGYQAFLELGPRPVLSAMARRALAADERAAFAWSLHPDQDDVEAVTEAAGALWVHGVDVDRGVWHPAGHKLALPPTARVGQRFWLEAPAPAVSEPPASEVFDLAWIEVAGEPRAVEGDWVVFGSDDLAEALAARGAVVHREWVADPVGVVLAPAGDDPLEHAWSAAEAARRLAEGGHGKLYLVSDIRRRPSTGTLLGIGRVVALELPDRWGRLVDVDDAEPSAVCDALLADLPDDQLRVGRDGLRTARLRPVTAVPVPRLDPEAGAVWVTGAFGALGQQVARWLADHGIRDLVLTSRTGAASSGAPALVAELERRGVRVTVEAADVAVLADVERTVQRLPSPLQGIVHVAGTHDDGRLTELTWSQFASVQRPKVLGAQHLAHATAALPLRFLVFFSSAAGVLGTPGQANYAAANAFLDAFAAHLRAEGRPAQSLAWGPWEGPGMAGDVSEEVRQRWTREGVRALDPDRALELLGEHLVAPSPTVLVAPFRWRTFAQARGDSLTADLRASAPVPPPVREAPAEARPELARALGSAPAEARPRMLRDAVQRIVGVVLGRGPEAPVGLREGFFDAGMDSLMAVELRERLQGQVGRPLAATVAFDFPDVERLARHLAGVLELDLEPPQAPATPHEIDPNEPIAIVGAACQLPGGIDSPEALWALAEAGRDAITEVPPSRFDVDRYYDPEPGTPGRTVSRHGGFVDGIDKFDPQLFGISPREAPTLDPQQRMLLEQTWHALEDANIAPLSLRETRTGVYVGIGAAEYAARFDPSTPDVDLYAGTGNETSFAAGRVAYALRLQGPAMSVNTACSSSLVAVHLAVQALRRGECEVAVAGGVNAIVAPDTTLWLSRMGALSPRGRCHSFDHRADGYVRGEGCGVVVLKRLSAAERDGNRILAVIRGSAVNHDGPSSGLTAPNGAAQQAVVRAALADGGLAPDDVGFVECHGTGTPLGDPIEVQALGEVFGAREEPLYLGAIKSNLGHLEAAAGIAGLLEAIGVVQRGTVPPLAQLEAPNPALPLEAFPALALPAGPIAWSASRRVAGVSSFGISGTNAHVLLEAAPERPAPMVEAPPAVAITWSARTSQGLERQAEVLRAHVETHAPALADLAWSQNVGRSGLAHRAAVVVAEAAEVAPALARRPLVTDVAVADPAVVFLCTGAGPQEAGMGRALYERAPVFREALDAAVAAADEVLPTSLGEVLFPSQGVERPELHDLAYTQPAMFALQWAMAALWASYGVRPAAVVGHSTGQFIAAALAGVFDMQTGIQLLARRAALMSSLPRDGAMVSVFADEETVLGYLRDADPEGAASAIAAVNGPTETVISGRASVVDDVAARLEADGAEIRRLRISHAAHSPLMDPILDRFEALMGEVPLRAPRLPLAENVRGELAGAELLDPAYWRQHMREPVQLARSLKTLHGEGLTTFLELGNHPVLAGMGARCLPDVDARFVPSLRRGHPAWATLLEGAARLWARGVDVDWACVHRDLPGRSVGLPGTVFERARYWVERPAKDPPGDAPGVGDDWVYAHTWAPIRLDVGAQGTRSQGRLLILADEGGLGDRLAARQQRPCTVVHQGDAQARDLPALVDDLQPADIVALWSLDAPEPGEEPVADAEAPATHLLHLIQALLQRAGPSLTWVSRGAVSVAGEAPALAQAPALGLAAVAAVEVDVPLLRVDLDPAATDDLAMLELVLGARRPEDQLAVRGARVLARRLSRATSPGAATGVRADGTYLVTGGRGALGLRVARWLADAGAGGVLLLSRSAPDEAQQAVIDELEARPGQRCMHLTGDVAEPAHLERVLATAAAAGLPGVRGVFHAAGVVEDASLATLEAADFAPAWRAKIAGAHLLDRTFPDVEPFVLFSSAASMLGSAGQGAYAAANAYLDALAHTRRARGRHGVSIGWGPWADGGLATVSSRAWEAGGVTPLPPAHAVQVLGRVLQGPANVAVVDLDWARWPQSLVRTPQLVADLVEGRPRVAEADRALEATPPLWEAALAAAPDRRRDVLADGIGDRVAEILRLPPGERVDPSLGFTDAGMDSLMAVELANQLRVDFDPGLPVTIGFDHPSVNDLAEHLLTRVAPRAAPAPAAPRAAASDEPIAIVGLSCRMPGGANDPEAFWELLRSGRDPMEPVPPERWDLAAVYDPTPGVPGKMYVREAGFVDFDLVETFDADFFGISGREAASLDPQQRMLLEVSYEALERADIPVDALGATRTGVYVGVGDSGYLQRFQAAGEPLYGDPYAGTGSLSAFVSGRVAYALGLQGPNVAVNTACSSALVAVHLACQGLRAGDCATALAGGVHLMLSPENFVYVSQLKALAPDGRCKTFDARADGYGRAEGCGMLVLKRLSDAERDGDPVLAVIRGSAMGHDGRSAGLTVPHGPAQEQVLADALAQSGLAPSDVSYLEAHGTGTELGDPIEVHAVEAVYGVGRSPDNPLHLGAVKSNIGHLEVAAGAASLIKMVLALQHREIPPHLHFESPNPDLDLTRTPLVISTKPTPWAPPSGVCRAGVSAFGLAGTNVHVVVEEAPAVGGSLSAPPPPERPAHVLPLSARSESALRALAAACGDRLADATLPDLAASAGLARAALTERIAVVAEGASEARQQIAQYLAHGQAPGVLTGRAGRPPRVAFLFSGQGSQYPGMGQALYDHFELYRDVVDRCCDAVEDELPRPLAEILHGADDDAIHDTTYAQPALYALEVALAELWRSFGVEPSAVCGHSIGQLAAAAVAGVFSIEDGARLVATRARLMGSLPREGGMLAVFADEATVRAAMPVGLSVAALNHAGETVVSGPSELLDQLADAVRNEGLELRPLQVSHAFHSALMEPILDEFEAAAARVSYAAPEMPVLCNASGRVADPADLRSPAYWRDLVREPVRFGDNLATLKELGHTVFVEVGPHTALLGAGRRGDGDRRRHWIGSQRRDAPTIRTLAQAVGQLWTGGVSIDWEAWDAPWPRTRVELPTYPWQRRRYWLDKPEWPDRRRARPEWFVVPAWEAAPAPAPGRTVHGAWLVCGPGPRAEGLAGALRERGATVRVAEAPVAGDFEGADEVLIVAAAEPPPPGAATARSAARVARWLQGALERAPAARITLCTESGTDAHGTLADPLGAALWSLFRVASLEHPELRPRMVDAAPDTPPDRIVDVLCDDDGEPEQAVDAQTRWVARLSRIRPSPAPELDADGTYLVTGGLRGLGLEVARSLAARGAGHLVLLGRSAPSDEARAALAAIGEGGTTVVVVQGDVTAPADVERAIAAAPTALRGLVHAAGVLRDASLLRLDEEAFDLVFGPKVQGAWNLHAATEARELDFFVLFSGGASLLGSPGQGNYAAANGWMDGFAHWARSRGHPVTAVNFGAWADIGMAARLGPEHAARQAREGIGRLPVEAGLEALGQVLAGSRAQVAILPVDWSRLAQALYRGSPPPRLTPLLPDPGGASSALAAPAAPAVDAPLLKVLGTTSDPEDQRDQLIAHIRRRAAQILHLPPDRAIDRSVPLLDLGLDSLLAVELKNAIADDGVDLPVARVMTGPSLEQLAALAQQIHAAAPASERGEVPGASEPSAAPPVSPLLSHFLAVLVGVFISVGLYALTLWAVGPAYEPGVPDASDLEQPEVAPPSARPPRAKGRKAKSR